MRFVAFTVHECRFKTLREDSGGPRAILRRDGKFQGFN
jgi:hypothetical protein